MQRLVLPSRARGLSTTQLLAILAGILAVLGLIALLIPRFRVSAMLIAGGTTLALLRFVVFKNAPGGPSYRRSRRRQLLVQKKTA